ncbi:MAG: HAMP domain-containing histidine kinase [Chloroflexi bacterium]|nr:MAG: HAMP domain-containing histidine kinase [Chloroflexota bacterium]
MARTVLTYAYLAALATAIVLTNLLTRSYDFAHPDDAFTVAYLCIAAPLLNIPQVRIEQGRLSLVGIANQAAALVLNPLDATIVGIASSVSTMRRGWFPVLANATLSASINLAGSVVANEFRSNNGAPLYGRVLAVTVWSLTNMTLLVLAFRIRSGVSVRGTTTQTFTASFYVAFAYSSLAAILVSYVIDKSLLGYILATIVFVLALALTDTIAGRRVRRVLESELSDADRHLFHSRAVEGVVHNLRNHIATAAGYLKEIDPHRLDPVDREAVETATAATNDAVTVLRSLSQGATPRVSYATEPVDLNDLASRALGMARPRARTKEVELGLRESTDDLKIRADPLLLREVVTNLLNNAIDAVSPKGRVDLTTGRRGNGSPYFSVADNGPGVSEENRHHLFEPHFTTKEGGTGLGLFMSYGVVREHQGQLSYEGNRHGAVFTVSLPPWSDAAGG